MKKHCWICLGVVVCFLAAIPALAQNAALVGTVRDSQQGIIAGAMVTLTNVDTGVSATTHTDEMGNYEFPTVRPGRYSVRAEQPGFKSFVEPVTLVVEQRSRVDATLQVGEVSAEVTVQETAGTVQTESSALGDVVT